MTISDFKFECSICNSKNPFLHKGFEPTLMCRKRTLMCRTGNICFQKDKALIQSKYKKYLSKNCSYPGSMLSAMFSHTDAGLSPMPRTEAGHFFLDVNPKFFEIVLEWLRLGEIITDDPALLKGALSMANYFGLDKLFEESRRKILHQEKENIILKCLTYFLGLIVMVYKGLQFYQ